MTCALCGRAGKKRRDESIDIGDKKRIKGTKNRDKEDGSEEEKVGQIVVVDTNVLVSSLSLLNHLMNDMDVKLMIPWKVVQELDGLKYSTRRYTAERARAAVRWLHDCLKGGHPGVLTQTAEQSKRLASRFESKSADDRILAWCLLLKEDGKKVTLLTNDINLAIKGLIN